MGYIDDVAWSRDYAKQKWRYSKWAARRIARELSRRGIDAATIDNTLDWLQTVILLHFLCLVEWSSESVHWRYASTDTLGAGAAAPQVLAVSDPLARYRKDNKGGKAMARLRPLLLMQRKLHRTCMQLW